MYGFVLIVAVSLSVYMVFLMITDWQTTDSVWRLTLRPIFSGAVVVTMVGLIRSLFVDILALKWLCGLQILVQDGGFLLKKGSWEQFIAYDNCRVVFAMSGWVMVWRLEGDTFVLLLRRRTLLWKQDKMTPYFKQCVEFITVRRCGDQVLKSLGIHIWRPWWYTRCPAYKISDAE